MAGLVQGARFSFSGFLGRIVGLSVESPSAEIVDMTGVADRNNAVVLVPTGAISGGGVTVDFQSPVDPTSLIGTRATLSLSSATFTVSRNAILEKANVDVRVGEPVRGTLTFRLTDYYGY